jgi:hypothetical protein
LVAKIVYDCQSEEEKEFIYWTLIFY